MTLTPRLAGLVAVLLLAPACSGDQDPGLQPADPPSSVTSESETSTPETGDPLEFTKGAGRTVFRCFRDGKRRLVVFDEVSTTREVTLSDANLGGDALRIERAWLAPVPRRAVGEGGSIDLDSGGTSMSDIKAWADRGPLTGATLEPRRRYTFFVQVTAVPDATFGDIELDWDDGATTGTSQYPFAGRTRSGGCP